MEELEDERLQQMLTEAEERGYQRGLNAQIDKQMSRPGVWEQPPDAPAPDTPEEEWEILRKYKIQN